MGSTPTPSHLSGRPDQNSLWKTLRGGSKDEKHRVPARVPDTFQLGAILSYTAFLASRKINKLRVFNTPEYSNSPLVHQLHKENDLATNAARGHFRGFNDCTVEASCFILSCAIS